MKAQKSQLVEIAQIYLNRAIEILETACEDDFNAQDYLLDHLKIMTARDHGFLDDSLNLDELKERYEGQEIEVDPEWYVHLMK